MEAKRTNGVNIKNLVPSLLSPRPDSFSSSGLPTGSLARPSVSSVGRAGTRVSHLFLPLPASPFMTETFQGSLPFTLVIIRKGRKLLRKYPDFSQKYNFFYINHKLLFSQLNPTSTLHLLKMPCLSIQEFTFEMSYSYSS